MIERIKFIQERTIDELLQLTNEEGENEYFVKAPTGSGKTYMQGYLISKLLKQYPKCKIIYQSLSKGSLAKQGFESINKYNFKEINPYLLSTEKIDQESVVIPTNYNVYFLPRDLNKNKGLLRQPLKDFLTYKTKNETKFLIIDECHEAHSNIDEYHDEFDRIFGFSATPTQQQMMYGRYVELEENECIDEQLIKKKEYKHENDPEFPNVENRDNILKWVNKKVTQSLEDFKAIKKDYKGTGVNPALIIQISNKIKGEYQKNKIVEILNKRGILWYYRDKNGYESSDKINELKGASRNKAWDYVRSNNSNIDVIIFKLAINVGVDIPRACYLLQIRETQSETLDEQVIGRIRRNPKLLEWDSLPKEKQDKLLIAYINGVEKQETGQTFGVKRKKNVVITTTVLKEKIPNQLRDFNSLKIKKYNNEPRQIFKLKESWDKLDGRIKVELIKKNGDIPLNKWIELCDNIETLNKQSYIQTYKDNIIKNGKFGLQEETFYRDDKYKTDIDDWNWSNIDNSSCYSFESNAEKEIARQLNILKTRLNLNLTWGKNYYNNSKIKFEYFLNQKGNLLISNQHPDFYIVKNDKVFLIEVKSLKVSNNSDRKIDELDYASKIDSIKSAYEEIAKVTNQTMVVMVEQQNGGWTSYVYEPNGIKYKWYNDDKFKFLEG